MGNVPTYEMRHPRISNRTCPVVFGEVDKKLDEGYTFVKKGFDWHAEKQRVKAAKKQKK